MAEHKVSVIRGDGVGIEVIEEGIKVLNAVGEQYDINWDFIEHPLELGLLLRAWQDDAKRCARPDGRV